MVSFCYYEFMIRSLFIGEKIGQSRFKDAGEGTFAGEFNGKAVIIKRGGKSLITEAATLQAIDDENIPKLIKLIKGEDDNILIMTRLEGVPLTELIELNSNWTSRPQKIDVAIRITQGVALAFNAVRRAGRLYRDLNLDHVLVGSVAIGLCDHEADVAVDDRGNGLIAHIIGTWETMAPEEFILGGTMSEASNTYTLGVLLLQLVMGNNPFFKAGSEDINIDDLRKLVNESHLQDPTINTGIVGVDRLLTKALAPRPLDRYQTIDAFYEAVKTHLI